MKSFFEQLFSKLLSTFIFLFVMLFISACFLTGEFPPRIQSLRAQYETFAQLKKTFALIMKNATERLQKAEEIPPTVATQPAVHDSNRNLQQEIREMRVEQLRLQSQVETLVQQNRELIRILTIPRSTN